MNWIITRHEGAVCWLRKHGIEGRVKKHLYVNDLNEFKEGDNVFGALPINLWIELLNKGVELYQIVIPGLNYSERDSDLSVSEMEERGTSLLKVEKTQQASISIKPANFTEIQKALERIPLLG